MIKAVIFDLDGLLIDSEPLWYKSQNQVLEQYGKSFTLQDYVASYAGRTMKENAKHLVDEYDLPVSHEEAWKQLLVFSEENNKNVPLKNGGKELIDYLVENNYKISLGSSSARQRAVDILKNDGVLDKFDTLITSENVKNGKPDPEIFLAAAKSLGLKPEECLVLEDAKAGVEAAYRGNIPAIFVPDLKQADDEVRAKTICVLDSLHDVITYLKENN